MSYLPRFIPRRCARAYAELVADPTLLQSISLFNDSTGPYYLVVRDFFANFATGGGVYTDTVLGAQGTFAVNGTPIVPGEPRPPGQVYKQLIASLPTPDYEVQTGVTNVVPWVHDFPFEILLPGWSLRITANTANGPTLEVSWFWQYCRAEDIDGSLEDLALKLAGA